MKVSLLFFNLNEEVCPLALHFLKKILEFLGDPWLGDTDRDDIDAWSPDLGYILQGLDQLLIYVVKLLYVDLLKGPLRTKLIDFVMYLVVNPNSVILACVIPDRVQNHGLR